MKKSNHSIAVPSVLALIMGSMCRTVTERSDVIARIVAIDFPQRVSRWNTVYSHCSAVLYIPERKAFVNSADMKFHHLPGTTTGRGILSLTNLDSRLQQVVEPREAEDDYLPIPSPAIDRPRQSPARIGLSRSGQV